MGTLSLPIILLIVIISLAVLDGLMVGNEKSKKKTTFRTIGAVTAFTFIWAFAAFLAANGFAYIVNSPAEIVFPILIGVLFIFSPFILYIIMYYVGKNEAIKIKRVYANINDIRNSFYKGFIRFAYTFLL